MESSTSCYSVDANAGSTASSTVNVSVAANQTRVKKPHEEELEECKRLLDILCAQSEELRDVYGHCNNHHEAFVLLYQNRARFEHGMENARLRQDIETSNRFENDMRNYDESLRIKAVDLAQMREHFKLRQQNLYNSLDQVQQRVICHLVADYKRRQQLAGNGCEFDNNLTQIQVCCENLMDCLWSNRRAVREMEGAIHAIPIDSDLNSITVLIKSYTRNIKSLLSETFILEKQPPQVMKTNTRFMASVRSLCGNSLSVPTLAPEVYVKIISEQQAHVFKHNYNLNGAYRHYPQQVHTMNDIDSMNAFSGPMQTNFSNNVIQHPSFDPSVVPNQTHPHQDMGYNLDFNQLETSGEILNSYGRLEYQSKDGQLCCNFRNMQLKKIKRAEKKGTESVMDEKFTLLFHSTHRLHDPTSRGSSVDDVLTFDIWAMSLPVVVIVHGNQEPHAWATITWDNAFAKQNRLPFKVPESVYWANLGTVLSNKFEYFCGRGLDEGNLKFLASKALRTELESDKNYHNELITWSQFAKDPLCERNFTFWEWFYSICKLTRDYLKNMWIDRRILGFASRRNAENLLLNAHQISSAQDNGTFLIRFSESELGGITVAWCHQNPNNNQREVLMLQPFSHKDLVVRSLADRIKDVKQLLYLYPDIPKDVAFQAYYTPDSVLKKQHQNNHYLQPLLVQTIIE